jgi:hypothetical protein
VTVLHLMLGAVMVGFGLVLFVRRETFAERMRSLALVLLLAAIMIANGLLQVLLGVN